MKNDFILRLLFAFAFFNLYSYTILYEKVEVSPGCTGGVTSSYIISNMEELGSETEGKNESSVDESLVNDKKD